ncbi:hypothetical protein EPN96_01175 [bacterium]|nr:MAG: hypothetical protein EPN96_01175 [bacterium]
MDSRRHRARSIPALMAAAVFLTAGQGLAQPPDYTKPNYTNSPILRKFVDSLPGLGPAGANNLGQYIPIAVPDTTTFPGSDYYTIGLYDYTQQMHSDLPATKLRGYRDTNPAADGQNHYLGPLIIAEKDKPVRVKFTNSLAAGAAGNLFLPVDTTIMGAGQGPVAGENYTQNRAGLHLHGGLTPWISDGTAHQWITPAAETTSYPKGLSTVNVPDMPDPGAGAMTMFYPNQQSGRLMFYHDHAYGLTGLNVYAGEASGYLLTDPAEQGLVTDGIIPADQIPLIIQDKTFVPDPVKLAATDPLWDTANWGGMGSLWFPHVYQPNQDPNALDGLNPLGRWDYGLYVWPPVNTTGPLPDISHVPEAFMDTPVVNGTAYPYLNVLPKAYRFRVLNACNDRFLNLQLYYAVGDTADPDGIHRNSGEADLTRPGPVFYQIGNEGGLMPAVALLNNPPRQVGYNLDMRSGTFMNVTQYNLLLGPAERADIVIDFSAVPPGSKLILYNDAPAPLPMEDIRYSYYTGNPDLTAFGGAPSTLPGYGPNVRTLMQFRVDGAPAAAFDSAALSAALPAVFAQTQPPAIVPPGIYGNNAMASTVGPPQTLNGIPIKIKTLTEGFDDLGRMNAVLGDTTVSVNNQGHTTFGLPFIAPPTEYLPAGTTQVWAIAHNGIDSHIIHFHLLNVQVVNRVDITGQIYPPDPNETGWKESVRFDPFLVTFIAVRPAPPTLPFEVPVSIRPLDVTTPSTGALGSTYDPVANPNPLTNFGWEYVWHCHLLGHEENDMMRPTVFQVVPNTPAAPTAAAGNGKATVTITAPADGGSAITNYTVISDPPGGVDQNAGTAATTHTITGLTNDVSYTFTVTATNAIGTGNVSAPSASVTPTATAGGNGGGGGGGCFLQTLGGEAGPSAAGLALFLLISIPFRRKERE